MVWMDTCCPFRMAFPKDAQCKASNIIQFQVAGL